MSGAKPEPTVPGGLNPVVHEWEALGDLRTARRELVAPEHPNFDAACYHAQQCSEKLMKAVLIGRSIIVPKTHDLVELDRLLIAIEPMWQWPGPELRRLSLTAVEYRYPGAVASAHDATWAVEAPERLWLALAAFL